MGGRKKIQARKKVVKERRHLRDKMEDFSKIKVCSSLTWEIHSWKKVQKNSGFADKRLNELISLLYRKRTTFIRAVTAPPFSEKDESRLVELMLDLSSKNIVI